MDGCNFLDDNYFRIHSDESSLSYKEQLLAIGKLQSTSSTVEDFLLVPSFPYSLWRFCLLWMVIFLWIHMTFRGTTLGSSWSFSFINGVSTATHWPQVLGWIHSTISPWPLTLIHGSKLKMAHVDDISMVAHTGSWDSSSYFSRAVYIRPRDPGLRLYNFTSSIEDNAFLRGVECYGSPYGFNMGPEGPIRVVVEAIQCKVD